MAYANYTESDEESDQPPEPTAETISQEEAEAITENTFGLHIGQSTDDIENKVLEMMEDGQPNDTADAPFELRDLLPHHELRPHQLTGVKWMITRENEGQKKIGGILADDTGYILGFLNCFTDRGSVTSTDSERPSNLALL